MWSVVFYTSPAGRQPVREFIEEDLSAVQRAKLRERLRLLQEHGPKMGEEYPKALTQLRGKRYRCLHEIRMANDQTRVLLFFHQGEAVLVHGLKKAGAAEKTIRAQNEVALARRSDWLRRRGVR
jgi:hypothetical protein